MKLFRLDSIFHIHTEHRHTRTRLRKLIEYGSYTQSALPYMCVSVAFGYVKRLALKIQTIKAHIIVEPFQFLHHYNFCC